MQFRLQVAEHYLRYTVKTGYFLVQMYNVVPITTNDSTIIVNLFCSALNHMTYIVVLAFLQTVDLHFDMNQPKLSISVLYLVIMLASRYSHSLFFCLKKRRDFNILRLKEFIQKHTQYTITMLLLPKLLQNQCKSVPSYGTFFLLSHRLACS